MTDRDRLIGLLFKVTEEKGGCKAFKRKTKISQLYYKLLSITNRNEFIKTLRNARKDYDDEPSSM